MAAGRNGGAGLPDWYYDAKAVTPADGTDLPDGPCLALYVGGAGNISLVTTGGTTLTLTGLLVGHVYRVAATRVRSTSTTATNIVALY